MSPFSCRQVSPHYTAPISGTKVLPVCDGTHWRGAEFPGLKSPPGQGPAPCLALLSPHVPVRVKAAVLRKEESMSSLRKQYEVSEGSLALPWLCLCGAL